VFGGGGSETLAPTSQSYDACSKKVLRSSRGDWTKKERKVEKFQQKNPLGRMEKNERGLARDQKPEKRSRGLWQRSGTAKGWSRLGGKADGYVVGRTRTFGDFT